MENLESRFVPTDAKLALELNGRHTRRETRDEVGSPEPRQQRSVAVLHDGAGHQVGILAASPATKHLGLSHEAERVSSVLAGRAHETIGPSHGFQVLGTGGIIWKELLELQETLGEREVFHRMLVFVVTVLHWTQTR